MILITIIIKGLLILKMAWIPALSMLDFISMSPSLLYKNVLRIWNTCDEF
ncbi:hypothetical protein NC652_011435 [Populus alba x Populus x berolinensis]|nr:hypothetical protein NC652_011435 [Populus alba x Populus x berolinensis]